FFSSRRRHTRFSRDWSSDVCSSDLASERIVARPTPRQSRIRIRPASQGEWNRADDRERSSRIPERTRIAGLALPRRSPSTALEPQVLGDGGLHLVEEELSRHAAEEAERRLQAQEDGVHDLSRIAAEPKQARVATDTEQRIR